MGPGKAYTPKVKAHRKPETATSTRDLVEILGNAAADTAAALAITTEEDTREVAEMIRTHYKNETKEYTQVIHYLADLNKAHIEAKQQQEDNDKKQKASAEKEGALGHDAYKLIRSWQTQETT